MSSLLNPAPYHILCYGALFGTEIFQSFVGGIVAFRSLPRPSFSTLQQNIFPVYFSMQTLIPVALALTYPAPATALTHPSIMNSRLPRGLATLLYNPAVRWSALVPLVLKVVLGAANLLVIGPETTKIMRERKHQETRDGKKSYDQGPHSEEMKKLNKRFGMLHGISTLVNMAALLATVRYGWGLGMRLV